MYRAFFVGGTIYMIEILNNKTHKVLFDAIKDSKNEIYLCAPFIKEKIAREILNCKKTSVRLNVITASNISNYVSGASDISALKLLVENSAVIYNFQNLHAKIYLFDVDTAIVTSANLTPNAMYNNFEYGLMIKDDLSTIGKIHDDCESMINNLNECGLMTNEILMEMEKIVNHHKENKTKVITDEVDDQILLVKNIDALNGSSWLNDILALIEQLPKNIFKLNDLYCYEDELKDKHPNNNHIKDKIRQILQQLRDLGFIKFMDKGTYKKMWIKEN